MAKQDHLIEYEKEALKELEALGKIIGRSPVVYDEIRRLLGHSQQKTNGKKPVVIFGIPKHEEVSWEKYVKIVLGELGGKRKKHEVVEYALNANPDIPVDTLSNAISGKLSKLKLSGEIGADEGATLSEGNQYYLIDNSNEPD